MRGNSRNRGEVGENARMAFTLCLLTTLVCSCGPDALDAELMQLVRQHQLTGNPAADRGLQQVRPEEDPLVRLGQILFFSQTLSGNFDSSCGTCHHPDFAATDGLSIAVGVAPRQRSTIGPGRVVHRGQDLDPQADGGPNMHRNSLTTFNAALHDRALMLDGRVFVLDEERAPGGRGQPIRTPETGSLSDPAERLGLLELVTQFPLVNDNEMRGFLYPELGTHSEYRAHLVSRLRGEVDASYAEPGAAARWLALFREGFGKPEADAHTLITMEHIQRALAAYVASQIFVDTPWKRYVAEEHAAIEETAKRGALLFFKSPEQGGLGCAGCHSGDLFTDERFHNVGFPQIGRGFRRADRRDPGRWSVVRQPENWFGFRTPGLLNVALTAPYGHAGTFANLEEVLRYHANPRDEVNRFDFSLSHLTQFAELDVEYPHAESHTRDAVAHGSYSASEPALPRRELTDVEVRQLIAFLETLTDGCASNPDCRSAWTPDATLDPDGHMLVRNHGRSAPLVEASSPESYPKHIELEFPMLEVRQTFPDVVDCRGGLAAGGNAGAPRFLNHTGEAQFGLLATHGFGFDTWHSNETVADLEGVMQAGGVTAAYLNDDCWPDLVMAGGDASGVVFYRNRGGRQGFVRADEWLGDAVGRRYTGVAVADLNGDYRRELVLGNVLQGEVPILAMHEHGVYARIGGMPMSRHTYGISFGLMGASEYPNLYLAHWSNSGMAGTAPALWKNEGTRLLPYDDEGWTSSAHVDQTFNFTPSFADFDGDGRQDLVLTSDFGTSAVLQNDRETRYQSVTERAVISDENGMGSALGDFDNDGRLDWFVTSVFASTRDLPDHWGDTGNRLYRNVSAAGEVRFENVTDQAGVADGLWGWGACAFDFDHDGFLDIFHVNGFGHMPSHVVRETERHIKEFFDELTAERFQAKPSRLFINQGNGTFREEATSWNIDVPSEGRGLACFDFDRDGDVDIAVLDHSKGIQFFENQIGHGSGRRFLNVRVVGATPNTDALGAEVTVTADVGRGHGEQHLLRVAAANSNFNSQNLPDLHFGLGEATRVTRIRVVWPRDAEPLVCEDVAVNQFLVFDQRDKRCP